MPKLEEGNFWIRATLPTSISLDAVRQVRRHACAGSSAAASSTRRSRATHPKHEEVITVVSQLGRPDDGTDVAGFQNIEFFAPLKPFDEWPRGLTKDTLTEEINGELSKAFPGVVFNFSQMISDNVEEAVAGVKGENSVKVFGPNLEDNEKNAKAIMAIMSKVEGVKDLGMFESLGQPNVKIVPDRVACARYGLNTGDVDAVVQAAVGGQAVTQVYEGEKHFDLTVRWQGPYRMRHRGHPRDHRRDPNRRQRPARPDREHLAAGRPVGHLPRGRRAGTRRSSSRVRGRDLSRHHRRAQARSSKIPRCDKRSAQASPTTRTSSGPARSTS